MLDESTINRLYNWKFNQAKDRMGKQAEDVRPTDDEVWVVQALEEAFGDCGWFDGAMGTVVRAAVRSLIGPPGQGEKPIAGFSHIWVSRSEILFERPDQARISPQGIPEGYAPILMVTGSVHEKVYKITDMLPKGKPNDPVVVGRTSQIEGIIAVLQDRAPKDQFMSVLVDEMSLVTISTHLEKEGR
jgi:hypothetical protein